MAEERLKLAVFIDFDNIQIGVKDTLGKEFDVSVVLEALKERGEVITKVAYGDWPRAGEHSKQMTQHAVQMVQRNVTPRGDKNGADINLALDALEMAFTRHHINGFAIVGGDSDFIALVEKLKQYDKQVLVVGGRGFTSNILQRNCTEFIAYENLLRPAGYAAPAGRARSSRRGEAQRAVIETRALSDALPNIQRALSVLAERGVSPQLGLLKSTLLQLDSTFSERDYGVSTFLEFMQKMEEAALLRLRKIDRGYLVESASEPAQIPSPAPPESGQPKEQAPVEAIHDPAAEGQAGAAAARPAEEAPPEAPAVIMTAEQALEMLQRAVEGESEKSPNRPLYLRHIRHGLRAVDKEFDERRAGFARITDLLHAAQREGWLSLQRDRKGVLRMFYRPPSEGAGAVEEAAPVQAEAAASTDFWESAETIAVAETPPAEPAAAETTPAESGAATAVLVEPAAEPAVVSANEGGARPDGAATAEPAPPRKGRARRAATRPPRKVAAKRRAKDRSD